MLWEEMSRAELLGLGVESPFKLLPTACLACGWKSTKRWWSNQVVFYFFEDLDLPHRLLATVYRCIVKGRLQ